MSLLENNMIKKSLTLLCLLLSAFALKAQETNVGMSDMDRIAVCAYVPEQTSPLPEEASAALESKMRQMISAQGMESTDYYSRFVVMPQISVSEKTVIPGVRPLVQMEVEVSFYLGDSSNGNVYGRCTKTLTSVQPSEQKAYTAAFKSLNVKDPEVVKMLLEGKKKILEYYETQIDLIIKQAESLAAANDFEAAFGMLISVPNVCKEAYNKAMDAAASIYQSYMIHEAGILLQKAWAVWKAGQDIAAAEEAVSLISQIDPAAGKQAEVDKLLASIEKRVKELDKREWESIQTQLTREYNLEKSSIEAARAVGEAWAKNQKPATYYTSIRMW